MLVPFIKAHMLEYEYEPSTGSMKEKTNDFVPQSIKVAMERKDRTPFDDPDILAEQFLLLVSSVSRNPVAITD